MTPERWSQVKTVLDAALARPPEERVAFVVEACGFDNDLRAEVESLLACDGQSSDFLETAVRPAVLRSLADSELPHTAKKRGLRERP